MDTHLLKIEQVAFFRKWKITLQDYCRPGDSERLQTLKTDLEQLGKLIDAQNKAYTFRMTDILLHYVVDLIGTGSCLVWIIYTAGSWVCGCGSRTWALSVSNRP
jgi:hypothetical protein